MPISITHGSISAAMQLAKRAGEGVRDRRREENATAMTLRYLDSAQQIAMQRDQASQRRGSQQLSAAIQYQRMAQDQQQFRERMDLDQSRAEASRVMGLAKMEEGREYRESLMGYRQDLTGLRQAGLQQGQERLRQTGERLRQTGARPYNLPLSQNADFQQVRILRDRRDNLSRRIQGNMHMGKFGLRPEPLDSGMDQLLRQELQSVDEELRAAETVLVSAMRTGAQSQSYPTGRTETVSSPGGPASQVGPDRAGDMLWDGHPKMSQVQAAFIEEMHKRASPGQIRAMTKEEVAEAFEQYVRSLGYGVR